MVNVIFLNAFTRLIILRLYLKNCFILLAKKVKFPPSQLNMHFTFLGRPAFSSVFNRIFKNVQSQHLVHFGSVTMPFALPYQRFWVPSPKHDFLSHKKKGVVPQCCKVKCSHVFQTVFSINRVQVTKKTIKITG